MRRVIVITFWAQRKLCPALQSQLQNNIYHCDVQVMFLPWCVGNPINVVDNLKSHLLPPWPP